MCRLRSISVTSFRISAILNLKKNGQSETTKWMLPGKEGRWRHLLIKDHGYKEPLTDRQKRVIERIRNGTDFHVSLDKIWELFK